MRDVFAKLFSLVVLLSSVQLALGSDYLRKLQFGAIQANRADFGHWGPDAANYRLWGSHSNRLIPVYSFGTRGSSQCDLQSYQSTSSPYRSEAELRRIYGRMPSHTLNPEATFFDQTDLFRIQQAALNAGKKYIFLVIFDGMDWQTTRAAAIYKTQQIAYEEGRGTGLHFQDYTANETTQFGYMCTSPHNNGTRVNVNEQTVLNPGGTLFGGYSIELGGPNPWTRAMICCIRSPKMWVRQSFMRIRTHRVPPRA